MSEYMRTIIYVNVLPCVFLLVFLFFLLFNSVFDRRQTKLFFLSSLISLSMIIVISADYLLSTMSFPSAYLLRRFTSFCNFAFSPMIPVLLYRISASRRLHWGFYAPVVINAVICSVSVFTGLVFYIAPNNGYGRGPLFILPFFISLFYMVVLMFQPERRHVKGKQIERGFLFCITLLLGLGMSLEIIFGFRFLTWDFTAPALIFYYMLLNIQSSMVDSLTGVYNRRMYNRRLSLLDGRLGCEIALLDINGFKAVNDLQGHDVGDRYLVTLTDILSQNFSPIATVFRIGGDEFVVISKKQDSKRFEQAMESSRVEAVQHDIRFACGMLTYDPTQPIQQSLVEADRLMYQDKKQEQNHSRNTARQTASNFSEQ